MFRKKNLTVLILTLGIWGCAQQIAQSDIRKKMPSLYKYLCYLPDNYDSIRNKKWPLIIYLHGKSVCGNDLNKLKRYGIPFYIDRGMQFKAVVVSPQCPAGRNWTSENWFQSLYNEITEKYHIDTNRIYLTGMSMGGFGAWDLAIKYPRRFAAVVPLCGGGKPQLVCAIKDVPIWVFHGNMDEIVPLKRSEEMVEALKKCGGDPMFTVLKGKGHDIHRTYGDEKIYDWMYKQKLN
jgi:predicted peptidase